jgi:NADPH:quinone reductase-like Zn-dependent oxidoreductase
LAVGAGLKVVSVSSQKNFENVKDLGASEVFDYNSPSVADDILKALSDTEYIGVCDCIGTEESAAAWAPVFKKLGGRYSSVTFSPPGIPDGIEGGFVIAVTIASVHKDIGEAVWGKYIPEALEKGTFRAKPEPTVIKGGLEKCQEGTDKVKAGMSFGKVVIEL